MNDRKLLGELGKITDKLNALDKKYNTLVEILSEKKEAAKEVGNVTDTPNTKNKQPKKSK